MDSLQPPAADREALRILVVDDEPDLRHLLAELLARRGHRVAEAGDGREARRQLALGAVDVAILDVRLPDVDGLSLLGEVRERWPETAVVLVTGYAVVPDAVAALKAGAYDYVAKPFDPEEFALRIIARLSERKALQRQLEWARGQPPPATLVGRSAALLRLREQVEVMAQSDAPVLITGESGAGKELVARLLHERSPRREKPFAAVNCAALPESLIEAELFGHERGAFTGADRKREGRLRAAEGGTFLFDEVGELPPAVQVKLLRVLQEKKFEPLGSDVSVSADVRVVAATHRSLKDLIAAGRFREDLYFRLNVLDLAVPPLRARREDLPLLVADILRRLTRPGETPPDVSPAAWEAFSRYSFPGNVRELEHALERAMVLARGRPLDVEHLPPDMAGPAPRPTPPGGTRKLRDTLRAFEHARLVEALAQAGGKRGEAAKALGISRKSLWEKLKNHGLGEGADEDQDD